MLRRAGLALATVFALVALSDPVLAGSSGWARYHPDKPPGEGNPYVRWGTRCEFTEDHPRREWIEFCVRARTRAIQQARKDHRLWLEELRASLEPVVPDDNSYPPPPHSGPINWLAIADCESGDGDGQPPYRPNWSYNGSSGYDGGLQFLPSTWTGAGGGRFAEYAWQAAASEQITIASGLSLSNWPYCRRYA